MNRPTAETSATLDASQVARRQLPLGVWIALGICFVGLALHVWRYDFLCDDAFISFRYARNFAQGHGLVFNPGFERVEGYSNFLWVLILAAGQFVGVAPEHAANPLLIVCGFALAAIVVRHCWKELPQGASAGWIVFPAAMFAANRSYAMWCTSGLETKLFELLVVGGVLATVKEIKRMAAGDQRSFPNSAVWFALACLTRPDGVLFAACVVLARIIYQMSVGTIAWRPLLLGIMAFVLPVGGQYIFRRLYYHDWLPNTYYAKVGGQTWWLMGAKYIACFALEYAVVLWAPLLAIGAAAMARRGLLGHLLIFTAAVVPHALYVASIGGDHFEYRVLDVYLPFFFIVLFHAACRLDRAGLSKAIIGGYLALCTAAGMVLPDLSHRMYPHRYRVGFPGLMPRDNYLTEFIDSTRLPGPFQVPGLRNYLVAYNDLIYETSKQFVGLRQEEHVGFLDTSMQQAKWLRALIDRGILPSDLHIATDCVGAIPYYTNLRVLDRVGLTDRVIARQANAKGEYRIMAHDKMATDDYLRRSNVDMSALDNVHFVLPAGHPRFLFQAHMAMVRPDRQVYADLGDGRLLLARAIQGKDELSRRVPRLTFRSTVEWSARTFGDHGERFVPVPAEKQFGSPYDLTYVDQGVSLAHDGYYESALIHFLCAAETNPNNRNARGNAESLAAWLEKRQGTSQPSRGDGAPPPVRGP